MRSRSASVGKSSTEDHQQFFTPPEVAKEVADLAVKYGPKNATYLECCAGDGAILSHLPHSPKGKRIANELDPKMCSVLRKKFPDTQVRCRDFLTYRTNIPRSKLVVATNPPYRGGWRQAAGKDLMWDIIRHAMTIADTGVFLLPAGARRMCSTSRHMKDLPHVHLVHEKTWKDPVPFRYGDKIKPIRVVIRVYQRKKDKRKTCELPRIDPAEFHILPKDKMAKANLYMLNWGSVAKIGELFTGRRLRIARKRFNRPDHAVPFRATGKPLADLMDLLRKRRPLIQAYAARVAPGNNPYLVRSELLAILKEGDQVKKYYN